MLCRFTPGNYFDLVGSASHINEPHQIPCSPQNLSSFTALSASHKRNMKKIVLKVELFDEKVKQKAMKVVSGLSGVDSIAMEMKEKRLTVTGDIDPVTIVAKLRKLCHTEIVTVGPAVKEPEKKKEDNAAGKKEEAKKPEAAGGAKKKEDQAAPAGGAKKKEDQAAPAGGAKKKEDQAAPAGGAKNKEDQVAGTAKKKEEPNKETPKASGSQQAPILPYINPCHQMPYGSYYNYPPPPPAYNYPPPPPPPPPQQLYYNQHAYSYQQSSTPIQYYYHSSVEEDPNSCIIS